MTSFQFDTSGYVQCLAPDQKPNETTGVSFWSDLAPFDQGYVAAMFADMPHHAALPYLGEGKGRRLVGFDSLGTEALARIRKDCERGRQLYAAPEKAGVDEGRDFWRRKQAGHLQVFPTTRNLVPLTVSLGDDGKVHLRERA